MSKRFTDTGKWDDPWFGSLTQDERMFWIYLLDKCDHAGIWKVNWPLVKFYIPGLTYDASKFNGRVVEIDAEKWFVPKFVAFQYGELNMDNRAHASVAAILKKEGAWKGHTKGLSRGYLAHKDKDKDKAKDKAVDVPAIPSFDKAWEQYPKKLGRKEALKHFKASVLTMQNWLDLQNAIQNYKRQIAKDHTEDRYVLHGSTFFNNWPDYVNYNGVTSMRPPAPPLKPKPVEKELTDEETKEAAEFFAKTRAILKPKEMAK